VEGTLMRAVDRFACVPLEILDLDLSFMAHKVYVLFAGHANDERTCWPAVKAIAVRLRTSESTVRRAITELIKKGAIERTRKSKAPSVIKLKNLVNSQQDDHSPPSTVMQDDHSPEGLAEAQRSTGDRSKEQTKRESSPKPESIRKRRSPGITPPPPKGGVGMTLLQACEEAVVVWNEVRRDKMPRIDKLTPKRLGHLKRRLVEECHHDLGVWRAHCQRIADSDFLAGRSTTFKATIDFAINLTNFIKIREGNYDNHEPIMGQGDPVSVGNAALAALAALNRQSTNGKGTSDDNAEVLSGTCDRLPVQAGYRH
jgi:hypothetical protein